MDLVRKAFLEADEARAFRCRSGQSIARRAQKAALDETFDKATFGLAWCGSSVTLGLFVNMELSLTLERLQGILSQNPKTV